jgi:hypothetical protein
MSIESFMQDACNRLEQREYLSALTSACIALEATGKAEHHHAKPCKRLKKVLNANLDIFTSIAFSGALLAMPGSKIHFQDPVDPVKLISLEDLIYKTIRCNLVHEACLPDNVMLTEEQIFTQSGGSTQLPTTFIYALILVVIGSPSNSRRKLSMSPIMTVRNVKLDINSLWGQSTEIRRLLQIE